MSGRLRTSFALFLIISLVTFPDSASGQGTTGTIRGKVTRADTGEPLPAVNIGVFETDGTVTTMGAFTNAEGEYVIINVLPGRYMLRASCVGYKTVEVPDLLATVGVSTYQMFALETTFLDVGETVVVEANRDLIQRDITATQQNITLENIDRMAATTLADILQMQSNIITRDLTRSDNIFSNNRSTEIYTMRGGRVAEIAFMVDGLDITTATIGFGNPGLSLSPFSLAEMVVMAGGMSAEFGNAMSGVVNMITREGGHRFDANVEIQSSEITGAKRDDVRDLTYVQGYLGGPVPLLPNTTFYVSGSAGSQRDMLVFKDDIIYDPSLVVPHTVADSSGAVPYPSPGSGLYVNPGQVGPDGRPIFPLDLISGWMSYGFYDTWDAMANITNRVSPQAKLTLSGQTSGLWRMPYNRGFRYDMLFGQPHWYQEAITMGIPVVGDSLTGTVIPYTGEFEFENESNITFEDNKRISFVWTHQPSHSTFYSLRGSFFSFRRDYRTKRWVNDDGYHSARKYWLPDDPGEDGIYTAADTVWTPDDPMHQVILQPISMFDYMNWDFNDPYRRTYGQWIQRIGGIADGTIGWDGYESSDTWTLKGDITSQLNAKHQVKAGFQYQEMELGYLDHQDCWNGPDYQWISSYEKQPWEIGIYVQNKIEYEYLILNLGLRYDASSLGETNWWFNPYYPTHPAYSDSLIVNPYRDGPIKVNWIRSQYSPRFGLAHPISERSVLYFNYGYFYQPPAYWDVYLGSGEGTTGLNYGISQWRWFGNPNLESEKTVSYEYGIKHQFTDIWALEVSFWGKDISNMAGSVSVPSFYKGQLNPEYRVLVNYDYGQASGIDISLIKRFSHFFSGRVSYSWMRSEANRSEPWGGDRAEDITLETGPKRAVPLPWDVPHKFNARVSLNVPAASGPQVLGIYLLARLSASVIFHASAGRPYTPTTKERQLEARSGRRPWTNQWDLKLYRDFETWGLRYSLFADIRNVFDRKNVVTVYSMTGSAEDPGPTYTSWSDQYDRSIYYGPRRTINLGVRFFF